MVASPLKDESAAFAKAMAAEGRNSAESGILRKACVFCGVVLEGKENCYWFASQRLVLFCRTESFVLLVDLSLAALKT